MKLLRYLLSVCIVVSGLMPGIFATKHATLKVFSKYSLLELQKQQLVDNHFTIVNSLEEADITLNYSLEYSLESYNYEYFWIIYEPANDESHPRLYKKFDAFIQKEKIGSIVEAGREVASEVSKGAVSAVEYLNPFQYHVPCTDLAIGKRAVTSAGVLGLLFSCLHIFLNMRSSINKDLKKKKEIKIKETEALIIQLREQLAVRLQVAKESPAVTGKETDEKNVEELTKEIINVEKALRTLKKQKILRTGADWRKVLNTEDAGFKTLYKAWYLPLLFLIGAQLSFDAFKMIGYKGNGADFYTSWATSFDEMNVQKSMQLLYAKIKNPKLEKIVSTIGASLGVGGTLLVAFPEWVVGSFLRPVLSLHPGIAQKKALENFAHPLELLLAIAVTGYYEAKRQVMNEQARLAKRSEICSAWDVWKKRHKVAKKINKKHLAARFTGNLMILTAARMIYEFCSFTGKNHGGSALAHTQNMLKEKINSLLQLVVGK